MIIIKLEIRCAVCLWPHRRDSWRTMMFSFKQRNIIVIVEPRRGYGPVVSAKNPLHVTEF